LPGILSQLSPGATIRVTAAVLDGKRELACAVMQTIATWAEIDASQGALMAAIAGAEPVAGAAVFHAIRHVDDRTQALRMTAKLLLNSWQHILLEVVLEIAQRSRGERDRFVGNIWGKAEELPDRLLLVPPAIVARLDAQVRRSLADDEALLPKIDRESYRQIAVYSLRDLEDSRTRARTIAAYLRRIRLVITEADDGARQWLVRQPEIQAVMPGLLKGAGLDTEAFLVPSGGQ